MSHVIEYLIPSHPCNHGCDRRIIQEQKGKLIRIDYERNMLITVYFRDGVPNIDILGGILRYLVSWRQGIAHERKLSTKLTWVTIQDIVREHCWCQR